nr:M1 family metallopeptidase [uncultured Flavobacterium sp.]
MKILKLCFFTLLYLTSSNITAQNKNVDFIAADIFLQPNFEKKEIHAKVVYEFEVKKNTDTIYLDAQNIDFQSVKINNKTVGFASTNKQLKLFKGYRKGKNFVEILYKTKPKQTVYFTGTPNKHQIWTQGQGKYTSHWLPSFDDVNEKLIFNTTITYPESYIVLSNGQLINTKLENGLKTWSYKMTEPMSSYLLMFAIGDYIKFTEKTENNTPLEFYLKPEDASKYNTTYKYSVQIFNFLENEIGVKYPWHVYRQVPVDDFLYAGMENTTATVFSQDYVVDAIGFNDKNYLNVNAHELAHQWFGNFVTAKESKHHWLQEGFATYYALLAERAIFGENYFNFELYDMAEALIRAQKSDKEPILSAKASSLTFYKKGAWALHYLQSKIGKAAFNLAVKNYLEKYRFQNVDTDQFLAEVENVSNYETTDFKKRWLNSAEFQTEDAFQILTQNKSISQYLEIGKKYEVDLKDKKQEFITILNSDAYINCKEEVVYQLGKENPTELNDFFTIISNSSNLKLRQAFIRSLGKVTADYKEFYKQFLNDSSYVTQEIVLKNMWSAFPEDRENLLQTTQNWIGFNDKNLRITWLTLALATPDYKQDQKVLFYDELLKYTQLGYESTTRQYAIMNLLYLNANDTNVLKSLANGLVHHKWQFVKFSKDIIRNQLEKDKYREYYQSILMDLNNDVKNSLERILQEKPSS